MAVSVYFCSPQRVLSHRGDPEEHPASPPHLSHGAGEEEEEEEEEGEGEGEGEEVNSWTIMRRGDKGKGRWIRR